MTVHLVDASGLIHRAFHAIKGLRNSAGLPTNALYGFVNMLGKFLGQTRPELVAVVLDAGRETFRNDLFDQYKANRPPSDPDLVAQFPYIPKLATAMGFPVIQQSGYEADDIIATLTVQARERGMDVVIHSGDKDLLQLVGRGVIVHDPMKDRDYDPAGVVEKMGVPPNRILDYLALVGDSSDNVPGVTGIGAKGAVELINAYGGLEDIYRNLDQIQGRKRTLLEEGHASAFLSRDLVRLFDRVPTSIAVGDLKMREPDRDGLVALYSELEFRGLLDGVRPTAPVETQLGLGQTARELGVDIDVDRFLALVESARHPAVVLAVAGRDPVNPDWQAIAIATGQDAVVTCRPERTPEHFWALCSALLARKDYLATNYKVLWQVFAAHGQDLAVPVMDPLLASYLLHSGRDTHSLEAMATELLSSNIPADGEYDNNSIGLRATAAFRMFDGLIKAIHTGENDELLNEIELPLARVLAKMERTGVLVDRDHLVRLSRELGQELQALEKSIISAAGVVFNPNSPKQLADVLFGKLGLPVRKKTKTGPSTNVSVLEELAPMHPVPQMILEYRSLAKLKGTYADALVNLINPVTSRIHTSYNQTVASTGRLSSSDPNLQNIPIRTDAGRRIRAAFSAREGMTFVSADYSQIELRVLAQFSGDEAMIDAFMRGIDIHARTAARIFGVSEAEVTAEMRRTAKVVNFGLLYGMGPFRLGKDLKIPQFQAKKIIEDYFGAFPEVREFLDITLNVARDDGYLTTLRGRRREIPGINSSNHQERQAGERMALNAPIQGSAADIIKIAMVKLQKRLDSEFPLAKLVLQVHDELVLEVPTDSVEVFKDLLKTEMENAVEFRVPLSVEVGVGRTWNDLH